MMFHWAVQREHKEKHQKHSHPQPCTTNSHTCYSYILAIKGQKQFSGHFAAQAGPLSLKTMEGGGGGAEEGCIQRPGPAAPPCPAATCGGWPQGTLKGLYPPLPSQCKSPKSCRPAASTHLGDPVVVCRRAADHRKAQVPALLRWCINCHQDAIPKLTQGNFPCSVKMNPVF